ncbi:MAG: c-type cytochrome, partial [Opitutaceae bacterium]
MKLTLKHLMLGTPLALAAVLVAAPVAENWENHCVKCHGADGKGQTKVGRKLNVKDYTDAKVQAEMKDADMTKATTDGLLDKNGKEK